MNNNDIKQRYAIIVYSDNRDKLCYLAKTIRSIPELKSLKNGDTTHPVYHWVKYYMIYTFTETYKDKIIKWAKGLKDPHIITRTEEVDRYIKKF